ncbi:hypothetical protein [Marvinbryantia formatexigens]|uniref:hypothetical protein n=1 Tax=Marvinbryantia formatexigens TaxID=168384 RepID=UPI000313AD40|nr:hypothetical protein [Marvinbryantia formatexigens]UWO24427.1 hypothetical protein NQ534_18730 [Marvinbryantia formatexigens DSM 14469]SDF07173.1 hypothetical protein SAMN05660368_00013 [Marvinbryantia formatexigens]
MKSHIVIDGNAFYEVDEECLRRKKSRAENTGAGKEKAAKDGRQNAARAQRGGRRT